MNPVSSVFEWLLGEWSFVREIPGYASVHGEAKIVPDGDDSARYEETALVSLAQGGTLRAKQCYLHRRLPPPANGIEVRFCDRGELFERLEFSARDDSTLQARARCQCAADVYESVFVVRDERLEVVHVVRGPRKNYCVETVYTRLVRNHEPRTRARATGRYNP
jgi:hypothetical protein